MTPAWLEPFQDTQWTGKSELWSDPLGNQAESGACSLHFHTETADYTWDYQGEKQKGSFHFTNNGVEWSDSWHQASQVCCRTCKENRGFFTIEYEYSAPSGPDWSWRMTLSQRPDDKLILQMTNIAPWGEEARAVRMTLEQDTT